MEHERHHHHPRPTGTSGGRPDGDFTMFRVWKTMAAVGLVTGTVLCGSPVLAQTASSTTSTSTSTSTSTTLLPHPFSPETRACVRAARQARRDCPLDAATCLQQYQAAFAKCFKGSTGEKCATRCLQNESKCIANVPTTKK